MEIHIVTLKCVSNETLYPPAPLLQGGTKFIAY